MMFRLEPFQFDHDGAALEGVIARPDGAVKSRDGIVLVADFRPPATSADPAVIEELDEALTSIGFPVLHYAPGMNGGELESIRGAAGAIAFLEQRGDQPIGLLAFRPTAREISLLTSRNPCIRTMCVATPGPAQSRGEPAQSGPVSNRQFESALKPRSLLILHAAGDEHFTGAAAAAFRAEVERAGWRAEEEIVASLSPAFAPPAARRLAVTRISHFFDHAMAGSSKELRV